MEALKTQMTKYESSNIFLYIALGDLNMEKQIKIEEIKEIEIKLEKLKIPKVIQVKKYLFQRNICVPL